MCIRDSGLGIGVVAVVDDEPVLRQADAPHTGAGGHIPGHAFDDLLLRQAQIFADGHGHGGGVDHVVPGGGAVSYTHLMDQYTARPHLLEVSLRPGAVGYEFWRDKLVGEVRRYLDAQ